MGGFGNAVVGGLGKLVRDFIRSANYVAGVAGWSINRDGSAEFNSGTFRGGVTVGAPGGPQVIITTSSGAGVLELPSGADYEDQPAEILAGAGGSPPFITLNIDGPSVNLSGFGSQVLIELNSANDSGTSQANGVFQYVDPSGGDHPVAVWDEGGFRIAAGVFVAAELGVTPPVGESWHAVMLKNSFLDGEFGPGYRSLDGGSTIAFHGQVITPSTGSVTGLDAFSVPTAYAPTFGTGVFVRWPATSQTNPGHCGYCELHPDGNVQLFGNFTNDELIDITGVTFIS